MTDYRAEPSIGARIRAARRQRGYRTTRDLAEALTGTKITESVLENIESGRKADLTLGQFLSIAYALRIAPSYLLARMVEPDGPLDLQNLSDDLNALTASEFDAWLSGSSAGGHRPGSTIERQERHDLDLLRELAATQREITRQEVIHALDEDGRQHQTSSGSAASRLRALREREVDLAQLLESSGIRSQPD
ncbi:helix-turn-helix domain-containing protein [Agromyces bracchium]|uniref:Helix-turn-helix domain-containing protein n=1 Tax=Agromyces bracchium TaxID=88376 RepID=A0A6I3MBL5_9MICO|nr:helix-turn-helix domain-containing protein [Agromyces bracchium]MTH69377.1 helix-turn-helix domain-containing protein [Agromyces bracchium]